MKFSSLTFLFVFFPLLLIIYYLCENRKIRNSILLGASLLFYAWGDPKYLPLLLLVIVLNYFFGIILPKIRSGQKIFFILAIISNLLILIYYKYLANFLQISLPIGISFYIFQSLSYLIDVYKNKVESEKNILNLALYLAFFPQLIAGPIIKYKDIAKQIQKRQESIFSFSEGLKRFIIGLAKKTLIANNAAVLVDYLMNYSPGDINTILLWLIAISYTVQIYFDFSGYSDMAIGLGKMFGFAINENFDYPYRATSVSDFWKRWHISLTSFFREYVYIPLGGNRHHYLFNFLFVWLLTGIWHGAKWNFLLWGLYYAIILLIDKHILAKGKVNKILGHVLTMFIVIIGWVIFRTNNLQELGLFLQNMFIYNSASFVSIHKNYDLLISLLYIFIGMIFSFINLYKCFDYLSQKNYVWEIIINIFYLFLFIACISAMLYNKYNPYIYFKF